MPMDLNRKSMDIIVKRTVVILQSVQVFLAGREINFKVICPSLDCIWPLTVGLKINHLRTGFFFSKA